MRHLDSESDAIVAEERAGASLSQRAYTDAEIADRCVFALIMEGGRILDEGIASVADDIDAIWVDGYGFPRSLGGPMAYARARGVRAVAAAIANYRHDDPAFWRDSTFLR